MEVKVGVKHFVLDNTTRAQTIVHERSSLTSTNRQVDEVNVSELTSSITPHFYSLLIIRLILSRVSIANLTYYVATFNTLRSLIFHTAKIRQFPDAAKFRPSNWGGFQHELERFSARAVGDGKFAPLSKPVVEFVELWNPFPQIPQSSQVENKTHEFRCSFIFTNYIS